MIPKGALPLIAATYICLAIIAVASSIEAKEINKTAIDLKFKCDSLENELSIQSIDEGRSELLIEKFKQVNPKEFYKALDEAE